MPGRTLSSHFPVPDIRHSFSAGPEIVLFDSIGILLCYHTAHSNLGTKTAYDKIVFGLKAIVLIIGTPGFIRR